MGDIINLDIPTKAPLDPQKVLQSALDAKLDGVVIMGWKGDDLYGASSYDDAKEILWLTEECKRQLFESL